MLRHLLRWLRRSITAWSTSKLRVAGLRAPAKPGPTTGVICLHAYVPIRPSKKLSATSTESKTTEGNINFPSLPKMNPATLTGNALLAELSNPLLRRSGRLDSSPLRQIGEAATHEFVMPELRRDHGHEAHLDREPRK